MYQIDRLRQVLLTACLVTIFSVCAYAQDNCKEIYGNGPNTIRLATGSPGELGLVKALAEEFNKSHDSTVCWTEAGSGASLKLLQNKQVDMIMVHAPAAEKQAIIEGWAIKRSLIGSNEFYIVGPKSDPAGISKAESAADAYAKIAAAMAKFFSRGDNSGTHKKEMAIWEKAGIQPSGDWYIVTKTFMTETLKMADENNGYFMTDSSTWVAAKKDLKNLQILFRGDPFLINTYHTLCQLQGVTQGQAFASEFIDFVISNEGQKIIKEYGANLYGEGLYNDAAYAKQYDH